MTYEQILSRTALALWIAPVVEVIGMIVFPAASGWFIFWWTIMALAVGVLSSAVTYNVLKRRAS